MSIIVENEINNDSEAIDFSKYTDSESLKTFYQWLHNENPKVLIPILEKGNRYGIHPYIKHQFEKYKVKNNLDPRTTIVCVIR